MIREKQMRAARQAERSKDTKKTAPDTTEAVPNGAAMVSTGILRYGKRVVFGETLKRTPPKIKR